MKQEEKNLVIKDICARLPYGVKIHIGKPQRIEVFDDINLRIGSINNTYADIRPYLFPLSSMTEEQREEIEDKLIFPNNSDGGWIEILYNNKYEIPFWFVDFCNKNHLDYRGLISMGLAIDCTNLNIY